MITREPLIKVYTILCYAYFPLVYFMYPETSRRTLEDMDVQFMRYPSIIVAGKSELTQRDRPTAFIEAENERIGRGVTEEVGKGVLAEKELGTAQVAYVDKHRGANSAV